MTARVASTSAVYLAVIAAFGGVDSAWAILALPAAVLLGAAFTAPVRGLRGDAGIDAAFVPINRFIVVPMFLFSGTFFPVSQLPLPLEWLAYATPLWHGVELCRDVHARRRFSSGAALGHIAYLIAVRRRRSRLGAERTYAAEAAEVTHRCRIRRQSRADCSSSATSWSTGAPG